ncbi:MAG TPA: DNA polymerase III subunit chi [Candidimonas sp.]|nr:DNA polymerase III subunit chi [Candidimonas sp.]
MSRIDFAFGAPDRLRMACEVVRKHVAAGRKLLVYTRDEQRLAHFDRLLWSFDPTAFIPHVHADDALAADTPVVLTLQSPGPATVVPGVESGVQPEVQPGVNSGIDQRWLLNLDLQCPPGVEAFERVLEIVSNHDEDKQAARERWVQYKAAGHTVHGHDVSKKAGQK